MNENGQLDRASRPLAPTFTALLDHPYAAGQSPTPAVCKATTKKGKRYLRLTEKVAFEDKIVLHTIIFTAC